MNFNFQDLYAFGGDHPWLFLLLVLLVSNVVANGLKFVNILVHGWPPAKQCNCDEDDDDTY